MKINILKRTDTKIEFAIYGWAIYMANALRRVLIAEVESWAIEKVRFFENSTSFPDEYIAHRLCLIPLKEANKCKRKEVKLEFENTASTTEYWYSGQMKTEDLRIPFEKIPIVKVIKGQKLKFKAIAIKGTGQEHSKWTAVCTCFFSEQANGSIKFIVETDSSIDATEVILKGIEKLKSKIIAASP